MIMKIVITIKLKMGYTRKNQKENITIKNQITKMMLNNQHQKSSQQVHQLNPKLNQNQLQQLIQEIKINYINSLMHMSIEFINHLRQSKNLTPHQQFIKKQFLYIIPVNYITYYTICNSNNNLNNCNSIIYIICSKSTNQWYIGETCKNLIQRMSAHVNTLCKYINNNCNLKHINQRLYRIWSKIGMYDFVIFPIEAQLYDTTQNRKDRERKLIQLYKPPLNTQYIVYNHNNNDKNKNHGIHSKRKYRHPFRYQRGLKRNLIKHKQIQQYDANNLPLFANYITSHQEYDNLNLIYKTASPGSIISIYRTPGRIDFTQIQGIKRKYKNSIIIHPLQFTKLSIFQFITMIKNVTIDIYFKIWIGVCTNDDSNNNTNNKLKFINKVVSHPNAFYKLKHIRNFSANELICLRMSTKYIKSAREHSIANARLYDMLMRTYKINYSTHLTIRIPYSPFISKHHITYIINKHISSLPLSSDYKNKLIERMRLVFLKSYSIGRILINNIFHAKNYDSNNIPPCTCNTNNHTHLKLKADHYHPSTLLYKVLSINNKNIPTPTRMIACRNIKTCILDYSQQIRRMTDYKLSTNKQKIIINEIHKNINLQYHCHNFQNEVNEIYDKNVYKIRDILKNHVVSSLDKNNGALLISCQQDYYNTLTQAFINDQHYKIITNTNTSIVIEQHRKHYAARQYGIPLQQSWYKLCGWNRKGSLPYVYINYKNKDLNKHRPIMSYYNHPMKLLFKLAGTALTFLLTQIPSNYYHFNLFNITHVKTFINNTNNKFEKIKVNSIYAFMMDIKNMYTEMKHPSIMKAVHWLVSISNKVRGHDRLAVKRIKNAKYNTHWGRSYNKNTHTELFISNMIQIIEYDMNNVIFTLGNVILQQINGIPMGGFISAPEAQLVCIYSEVQFHSSLGSDSKYISGSRYMDDLTIFIAYNNQNISSMTRVVKIINLLNHTYDEKLELEEQIPQNNNIYTYLECIIKVNNATVTIEPYQKNAEYIQQHQKQKLLKLQHYNSYSPTTTKIAVLVGTLHRLNNYTMNDHQLYLSIMNLWYEIKTIKYPIKTLLTALEMMYNKTNNYKWMIYKKTPYTF